ncbi:lipid-binding SYLF domain-containing protein [Roseomonas gilardii]|uniref:Lipid-binding SYLF domain-containing protein n=1 Tax=Roseomonas gilardii TaxID=257708 RepID=A0ABU3MIW0_9PROT|nr:lipid-binding SYLF domain-containing protein [Roseomonas gilardii]MDT8332934.1 lipid-binding SYLF domain-containing protein [Roseomonas gilardii]
MKRMIPSGACLLAPLLLLAACGQDGRGAATGPASAGSAASSGTTTKADPDPARLTEAATTTVKGFFAQPHWEGVRNLAAGARAIFIAPRDDRAGFILGAERAEGIFLVRHGTVWSDPVFITLTNVDLGFLAGASRSELIMYVLSDQAVQQFLDGSRRFSGSGGFALADWGLGGLGVGGLSGGVQALTIETSKGLFAGGGFGSARIHLNDALNTAAYGPGFDANQVLARDGGGFAAARPLRAELSQAVRQAASR